MRYLLFALLLLPIGVVKGQEQVTDHEQIVQVAKDYLRNQFQENETATSIEINKIDSRLKFPLCAKLIPFIPNGSKAIGRTSIGIKCNSPTWQVLLSANIQLETDYYITATALQQGQTLDESSLKKVRGRIDQMSTSIVKNLDGLIGKTLITNVAQGVPLKREVLRNPFAILQGQNVQIRTVGAGFKVSTEGESLNNATDGQLAKAKLSSGQVVNGIARNGGIIEIQY